MNAAFPTVRPQLRALDFRPVNQRGQPALYLRDPLQLSHQELVIPQGLVPVLGLCDGTRTISEIHSELKTRFGWLISLDVIERIVSALDSSLLLQNDRFSEAHASALETYRSAPFRPLAFAGKSYPADAQELSSFLNNYLDRVDLIEPLPQRVRGLLSPHIDYERGGDVYARVWKHASAAANAADLVIIFGTDHFSDRLINLTRQHVATPYGILPTARPIVDAMAEMIGIDQAFGAELRHKTEHSLELVLVWLHHVRAGRPVEVVPILTGSFARFWNTNSSPLADKTLTGALDVLARETVGRNVLVVASGDLAHVGPVFGGKPVNEAEQTRVRSADDALISCACRGDSDGFFDAIGAVKDRNNVCGTSPIFLMLNYLRQATGTRVAYAQCPADNEQTSFVSIGGVIFA